MNHKTDMQASFDSYYAENWPLCKASIEKGTASEEIVGEREALWDVWQDAWKAALAGQAAGVPDERAAFEDWAVREFGFDRCDLARQEDGYAGVGIDNAWDGWQARGNLVGCDGSGAIAVSVDDWAECPVCDGSGCAAKTHLASHEWDEDGERCIKCGDKDWMADELCSERLVRMTDKQILLIASKTLDADTAPPAREVVKLARALFAAAPAPVSETTGEMTVTEALMRDLLTHGIAIHRIAPADVFAEPAPVSEPAPYSAPFTTDVPHCCGEPSTCKDPCGDSDFESDKPIPIVTYDDGARVILDSWTGGAHESGVFGEVALRFIDAHGVETVREYCAKDAEQPSERGEQDCPHGVDDGACKQCYGEAMSGEQGAANDQNSAKHRYFVYDPEGNGFDLYDTDAQREAAHLAAIAEARQAAMDDGEWSLDVERIVSGFVTHTTVAAEMDGGGCDYAPLSAFTASAPTLSEQHTDDLAVDSFARAMKEKMAAARAKGRSGWEGVDPAELSRMLREHVEKGDPRDVANFCMMLWHHSAPIAPAVAQPGLTDEQIDAVIAQFMESFDSGTLDLRDFARALLSKGGE